MIQVHFYLKVWALKPERSLSIGWWFQPNHYHGKKWGETHQTSETFIHPSIHPSIQLKSNKNMLASFRFFCKQKMTDLKNDCLLNFRPSVSLVAHHLYTRIVPEGHNVSDDWKISPAGTCLAYPPWKFNSLPLNICRAPKRRIALQLSFFQRRTVKLGGSLVVSTIPTSKSNGRNDRP